MNRTIKFRGKKASNGIWVYGYLVELSELNVAIYFPVTKGCVTLMDWGYVDPDTVGQFTGLFDKNGKEIYEGDILRRIGRDIEKDRIAKAEYIGSGFQFGILEPLSMHNDRMEVIGNIHDNPELLKSL